MVVGDFDVFDSHRQDDHIFQITAGHRQQAGIGRTFEGHGIAALAVSFFEIRRENQSDLRQCRHQGRRNSRDRVVEVLAQILFRYRQGSKIRKLTGEGNHLAVKTSSELFYRQLGAICICRHPRRSIVSR